MNASHLPAENLPRDLIEHLRTLAETRPSDTALTVVTADATTSLSYAELDRGVRAAATYLQARFEPGDRVLLLLDNNEHYVVGFLACLYAGLIAVPGFPPESLREHHLARLRAIVKDAQARCVIVSADLVELVDSATDLLGSMERLVIDAVSQAGADRWQPLLTRSEHDVIFLQYTSGSTATPKGVIVDHGNLLANERAIRSGLQIGPSDVFVSWLPLFHDMGLVGGLFQPIYSGIPLVLTSPAYFLEQPARWLELISRYRGSVSGGPDFAYRLCLERISDAQLRTLDLSSWRVAFSGAEPVRHDTLRAFAERFRVAGFDARAVYPCYGLAEATLFVTGGRRGSGMTTRTYSSERLAKGRAAISKRGTTLVGCGVSHSQHRVRIVDPETRVKRPNARVGEIWVSGPSVSRGYWQREQETAEIFVEQDGTRWLRTGDLGFVQQKELFITGRQKDLIILHGHNVYPQDVERAIEAQSEAVRKGRVAAFAVQTATREGVGVAVEVSRSLQKLVPPERLVDELSSIVSEQCHEPLAVAVLLNPGALPKTSSGKVQRSACRDGWRHRTLDAYAIYEQGRFVQGVEPQTSSQASLDDVEQGVADIWRSILECDSLGPDAHFFVSGGSSLSAVQVASRLSDRWNVEFPVRALFERPTLKDTASEIKMLLRAGGGRESPALTVLPAEKRARSLPLSFAQQRLWFLWKLDPADTAYHICGRFRFSGQMNVEVLRESFAAIVQRHESLRTVFRVEDDGEARQIVLPALPADITAIDLRPVGQTAESRMEAELRRIQETPFDLSMGPLVRIGAIQRADAEWLLVLAIHHIICDGWSMQLVLNEFAAQYAARLEGRTPQEEQLPVQYVDYAAWQREWLSHGVAASQLRWWRERLGEEHPVLELPVDRPRRQAMSSAPGRREIELPKALVRALRRRADEQGATLFVVLLAAFQALLHRYTGQCDVRVGVPVANRNRTASEEIVGFFVNTLVLGTEIDGRSDLATVVRQVMENMREAQAHQDLPFEQLVEALQPQRDLSQSPLFRVVMNHLRVDDQSLGRLPGLRLEEYWIGKQAAQFELALDTVESSDGDVIARFTYAVDLFDSETIAQLGDHYMRMLELVAWRPQCAVRDVELLSQSEHARLMGWSENADSFEEPCPIHHLFERQAAGKPDAIAVIFKDRVLRYAELNASANRLAHRLIASGVEPDTRVGVAMERSIDMVVALLGIMKAGGAYVPLDPENPPERLSYMVKDSGIELLLTQPAFRPQLSSTLGDEVSILVPDEASPDAGPARNPAIALHGNNLVYVIYTSGSTGRPKGTANCHSALYNRLKWGQHFDPLRSDDVVVQKTPFTFDISFWEFFWPLTTGATLVMSEPGAHRDPMQLVQLVRRHGVTTIHFVPSMLQAFLACEDADTCSTLRRVICSGEALPVEAQSKVFSRLPRVKLHNFYGPTEAAIEVTYWTCADEDRTSVPIGRPIAGTQAIILDEHLQLAPQGVVGELYLGGKSLARGYPTRRGLTAERFVANPFSVTGARIYRTGDLARWRSDGQIEYVGRADHQVKIRGHRIELGEIEAKLRSQPRIREAAVIARDTEQSPRLIAYVVPDGSALDVLGVESGATPSLLVDEWESVFESAYGGKASGPDFRGWNSSYTDQPIPATQMQEWLQATVDRINALEPEAILEIGCGVGLLVQQLAPGVSAYLATDFSARAVDDLRSWTGTQPSLSHVQVRHAEAADFSAIADGQFDTVVLNSVAQYFPSADYLLEVLRGAARVVGSEGRIFVGDVRHLAHLPAFHTSVQLAKAPAALTVRHLRRRIRRAMAQDKELVLDPAFFHAVASSLQLGGVEVALRRGHAESELTRYRYDVVLRAPASVRPQASRFDWPHSDGLGRLTQRLVTGRPVALRLSNVPNLRVARDLAAWRLLQASKESVTVAGIRAQLNRSTLVGVDPEDLWALGEQLGYAVSITWTSGASDGSMDVEFVERASERSERPVATAAGELPPNWHAFASDPLRLLRAQQLQVRIRKDLGRTLPDYMVPSAVVVMESLPLNANGKLDRKALPEPDYGSTTRDEPPQGETEAALAAIWSEVLGVDRVGRHDNFFELGGHSLAAMRVAACAQSRHGITLPIRAFFEAPTISAVVRDHGLAARTSSRHRADLAAIDALLAAVEE